VTLPNWMIWGRPFFHGVHGHGEPDPARRARRADDDGVHADELAGRIEEGPPELPGLIEASVWIMSRWRPRRLLASSGPGR